MYEPNQIVIPDAFMALYCVNGRPVATRESVEARYDLCEDMALQMTEFCSAIEFKEDLSHDEVLRRCHAGLLAAESAVTPEEAGWIVSRTAELLNWSR